MSVRQWTLSRDRRPASLTAGGLAASFAARPVGATDQDALLCGEGQGVGGEAGLRDTPGTRLEAGGRGQKLVQLTAPDPLLPPLDLDRPSFAVLCKRVDLGLAIRRPVWLDAREGRHGDRRLPGRRRGRFVRPACAAAPVPRSPWRGPVGSKPRKPLGQARHQRLELLPGAGSRRLPHPSWSAPPNSGTPDRRRNSALHAPLTDPPPSSA